MIAHLLWYFDPLSFHQLSIQINQHLWHVNFDLIHNVPSTIFQLNSDGSSWVEPVLSYDKCVLLKDHNAVTPVKLEAAASQSRVKHSTKEPLRSLMTCERLQYSLKSI